MTTDTARRVVAALFLAAPFAGLLWVPWYAGDEPFLAGMPFFYWYQLAWVPASTLLMLAAYRLVNSARSTTNPGGSP